MTYKKISIIIPVYNEEQTILKLIKKIKAVSLKSFNLKKEIIIVDDGSTDHTRNLLGKIHDPEIKIDYHKKNCGKGTAIRTALEQVTGDIVIIQDADLEYEPQEYPLLITPIIHKGVGVVYGSRILKKDNKRHSGIFFYWGGLIITWFTNVLYNTHLTDVPTCYKVFKTELLRSIDLKCKKFEFCPEVTAKLAKRGIKIHEIPISYYPRSKREGKKIQWKDGFQALWWLLKLRFLE